MIGSGNSGDIFLLLTDAYSTTLYYEEKNVSSTCDFNKSHELTKKPRVVKKFKKKPSLSRRGRLPRAGEKKTQKTSTLGYGKKYFLLLRKQMGILSTKFLPVP
jgi:hypothetical protein